MKPLLLSVLLALGAGSAIAQTGSGQLESMKIHANEMPPFPATLIARGITSGTVRVVARVSETGRLEDWLVTAYSHPTLAKVAVDALQEFTFTPARFQNQPTTAQSEVEFRFRVDGVVVSQNMMEHFLSVTRHRNDPDLVYAPCSLRDLDGIPTPVHVVSPYYDRSLAEQGLRGDVTIDFYIDEQGQVRLPVVNASEQQQLAALALDAVQQWKFEPPTRRGQPVLVQARQRFHFGGGEQATVAAPGAE